MNQSNFFSRGRILAIVVGVCSGVALSCVGGAQLKFRPFNNDESKVAPYKLPDPLVMEDGRRVTTASMWYKKRRPEIMNLFAREMFGYTPTKKLKIRFGPVTTDKDALGGKAIREQVTLYFSSQKAGPQMHLLLYIPKNADKPVPVFFGLNWSGNQAISADPGIELHDIWLPDAADRLKMHRQTADPATRGKDASEWQLNKLLADGYALATAYYGDIEPDFDGGIQYGVRPLFFKKGQMSPGPDQWGTLGAWAWGMSRAVDFLDKQKAIDSKEIVLIGHSRLGKAALWAGAQDPRFAIVVSSESGKGGAALMKRDFGETIEHLNQRFPYWYCANFKQYSNHADELPFDSHMLLALIAPRPLYIGSAAPTFLDPKGEFLAAVNAGPVYRLLGKEGLGIGRMPPLNHPIMHTIGYHERSGKHDVTAYDWDQYLKFADIQFGRARHH